MCLMKLGIHSTELELKWFPLLRQCSPHRGRILEYGPDQCAENLNKVVNGQARFLDNAQRIYAFVCLLEQIVYMSVLCKVIADV